MRDYVKKTIDEFPEYIDRIASTPATENLYKIRDRDIAQPLTNEMAAAFHHTVAQLLFMSSRARKDIQTAVAFLTTRVKGPYEDDWGKVKRVLKYLNGTRNLDLTLSANDLGAITWYVDASYTIHNNCKGQS